MSTIKNISHPVFFSCKRKYLPSHVETQDFASLQTIHESITNQYPPSLRASACAWHADRLAWQSIRTSILKLYSEIDEISAHNSQQDKA